MPGRVNLQNSGGVDKSANRCAGRYNRYVRIISVLLILLSVAACNRGGSNKDAVRQGVLDYLSGRRDLNITSMDVDVTSVQFNGNRADATVTFSPKGATGAQGMTMNYQLEQQGGRWTVVGKQDSASHAGAAAQGAPNPHGGGALPGAEGNPHGGGGGAGGVRMPSPDDLPPTGGKK
jgi:hypothetical protein